jgi:hypothetical protein
MQIELSNLVDKIIGSYSAYGSHGSDMEACERLDDVRELVLHIVSKLSENARKGFESQANSVVDVGKKSNQILNEIYNILDNLRYDIGRSK